MKNAYWNFFILSLVLLAGFSGISPLPFGFIPPVFGIVFFIIYKIVYGEWPRTDWVLYAWALTACLLTCLSTGWSITPDVTFSRSIKICAVILFTLPLLDLARSCPESILNKWRLALPISILFAGMLPLVDMLLGMTGYNLLNPSPAEPGRPDFYNKHVAIFVLLLPIGLLYAHKEGAYTVSFLLLTIAILIFGVTASQASQIALLCMIVAYLSQFIMRVTIIPATFTGLSLLIILMPWLSPLIYSIFAEGLSHNPIAREASVSLRLENWDFISRKIMENPLIGFGMDTTRSITDFQTRELYYQGNRIMHPHNLALQVWIEFGLPGIILTISFLGFLLRRFLQLSQQERRIPFTVFCGLVVFLMISWSIWSSWLLGLSFCLVAFMILAARTNSGRVIS